MRKAITVGIVGLGFMIGSFGAPAAAQVAPGEARLHRRPPLRLEVRPLPRYVRQCVAWYVVEPRATGPTVVPREECRWAVRPRQE